MIKYFNSSYLAKLDRSETFFLIFKILFFFIFFSFIKGIYLVHFLGQENNNFMYGEYSYATILLLGTVWAPLKEEFTFRYFLDKKKYTAVISFSLFVATVLLIITKMIFSIGTLSYLLFCIYAIIISPAVYYFVLTKRYVWNENNILYSSVLFGLVHLSNFNQDQFTLIEYYPYLIFYIISISFMGYIFAIIRIRFGMKYNLLIHSLFNLLVFI